VSLASWFRNLVSPRSDGPQAELGRNDLCWCGSGKKYKRCHLKRDELKRVEASYSAQMTARQRAAAGMVPGRSGKARQRLEKAAAPAEKR
jgi:uncharacterized protein YecA (UPF0149 family)